MNFPSPKQHHWIVLAILTIIALLLFITFNRGSEDLLDSQDVSDDTAMESTVSPTEERPATEEELPQETNEEQGTEDDEVYSHSDNNEDYREAEVENNPVDDSSTTADSYPQQQAINEEPSYDEGTQVAEDYAYSNQEPNNYDSTDEPPPYEDP